jgi:hypothetical protein
VPAPQVDELAAVAPAPAPAPVSTLDTTFTSAPAGDQQIAAAPTPAPPPTLTPAQAPAAAPTPAPAGKAGRPAKHKADTSGTGPMTKQTRKSKQKTAGKKR